MTGIDVHRLGQLHSRAKIHFLPRNEEHFLYPATRRESG